MSDGSVLVATLGDCRLVMAGPGRWPDLWIIGGPDGVPDEVAALLPALAAPQTLHGVRAVAVDLGWELA